MNTRRLFRAAFFGLFLALAGAGLAFAQDEPPPDPGPPIAERVGVLVAAFDAVAQAARSASDDAGWQAVDAAYNRALDALDVHQGPMIEATAGGAGPALQAVEAALAPLELALDGTDAIGVQVVVAQIRDALDDLAPVEPAESAVSPQATALRDWQARRERAVALLQAGRWRDARNEAIALIDGIERGGPAIAALSPAAPRAVEQAGLFALRLRAAALDQSVDQGLAAGRSFDRALQVLLVASGAEPPPTSVPPASGPTRLRGYQVVGAVGEEIELPIVAEDVPQIGLGALRLNVAWSPRALRLQDIRWELDAGQHQRDDTAGRVLLELPQAPLGPSGDVILASLRFTVLPDAIDPRELLPADELAVFDAAIDGAVEHTRLGDLPQAAALLASAHAAYFDGRGVPGSLYEELDRYGQATGLADALEGALMVASQEGAANDEVVVAAALFSRSFKNALETYGASLAAQGGIPVRVDVLDIRDRAGNPLPVLPSIAGEVLLAATPTPLPTVPPVPPTPDATAVAAAAEDAVVGDEDSGPGAPTREPGADSSGSDAQGSPSDGAPEGSTFPRLLFAALLLAAGIGAVAAASALKGDDSADGTEKRPEAPQE